MVKCKNCGNKFEGKFCNMCGQRADTRRLDFHFLWHDIQHGLFHFDKGVVYSFRQLYLRPGHSIREFVEGKRVGHFQPISLVILLAVFYGLLYHGFKIDNSSIFDKNDQPLMDYEAYNEWISTHFSWITLALIPIYSIGTQLCFRKQGYNFTELFILNAFKASQRLFLHIATIPLLLLYNHTSGLKNLLGFLFFIDTVLNIFTDQQFFDKLPVIKAILLSIVSQLIFIFILMILGVLVLLVFDMA